MKSKFLYDRVGLEDGRVQVNYGASQTTEAEDIFEDNEEGITLTWKNLTVQSGSVEANLHVFKRKNLPSKVY